MSNKAPAYQQLPIEDLENITQPAVDLALRLSELTPESQKRIEGFIDLMADGDTEATEFLAKLCRENVEVEEREKRMDEYLAEH